MLSLLAVALPAYPSETGLILIPTAETAGAGQYVVDFTIDASCPGRRVDAYVLNTQFGVGDRFEAGVDLLFAPDARPDTRVNWKYLFAVDGRGGWAAAGGISSITAQARPSPYAVVSKWFETTGLHLGVIRPERSGRWMVGADHYLTDRLRLLADHITGEANSWAVGLEYSLNERAVLCASLTFPNTEGDTVFSMTVEVSGPYR